MAHIYIRLVGKGTTIYSLYACSLLCALVKYYNEV